MAWNMPGARTRGRSIALSFVGTIAIAGLIIGIASIDRSAGARLQQQEARPVAAFLPIGISRSELGQHTATPPGCKAPIQHCRPCPGCTPTPSPGAGTPTVCPDCIRWPSSCPDPIRLCRPCPGCTATTTPAAGTPTVCPNCRRR